MVTNITALRTAGPSGFIEFGQEFILVDYGQVIKDGVIIGKFFDDGFMEVKGLSLGNRKNKIFIDQLQDVRFKGSDSYGLTLILPLEHKLPSGDLKYDGILFKVVNGKICTSDHRLVGFFDNDGTIYARDNLNKRLKVKLEENTQLNTSFLGINGLGQKFEHTFNRPLSRPNKNYTENEILRYFESFDTLTSIQKKYVVENLNLWAASGILQIVRKSEGTCAFGDIKHGASGVTGIRTGYVTLDKKEFETEIKLFYGEAPFYGKAPLRNLTLHDLEPYVEARVNMVVAHEFGHQLEFTLCQKAQDQIAEIYMLRKDKSNKINPLPSNYNGKSEILHPEKIHQKVFYSGYAKESAQEFFAESVAAFSVAETRNDLKLHDPELYNLLSLIIFDSSKMIRSVYSDLIMDLQASLRLAGIFTEDLL